MQRQTSTSSQYKPELDGLRTIAIILTVLAHTGHFTSYSVYGVDIFFVLSGYFISDVFIERKLSVKDFIVNRFARLYPLILLYSIIALLFSLRFRTPGALGGSIASLFMVKNFQGSDGLFGHFWSLSAEFQFYLLVAILVAALGHSAVYFFTAPVMVYILINIAFFQSSFTFADPAVFSNYNQLLGRPCEIWLGIFAFYLCRRKIPRYWIPVGISFFLSITFFILTCNPFWIALSTLFVICYLDIQEDGFLSQILGSSIMRTIGMLSFSIYIWHLLIVNIYEVTYIHLYRRGPVNTLGSFLLVLVVSTLVGYFSYKKFEMPVKARLLTKFRSARNS